MLLKFHCLIYIEFIANVYEGVYLISQFDMWARRLEMTSVTLLDAY